jgi:transcriptional regulator with XRE-family HTH domain
LRNLEFGSYLKRVGVNLRTARWLRGLTQEELASTSGLTYRYVAEVERGLRNPTLRTMFALAFALGTTVAALVEARELSKNRKLRTRCTDPVFRR